VERRSAPLSIIPPRLTWVAALTLASYQEALYSLRPGDDGLPCSPDLSAGTLNGWEIYGGDLRCATLDGEAMVGLAAGGSGAVATLAVTVEPEATYTWRGEFFEDALSSEPANFLNNFTVCSGALVARDCPTLHKVTFWSSKARSAWQPWRINFVRFRPEHEFATFVVKLQSGKTAESNQSLNCAISHHRAFTECRAEEVPP
jgi:hypothetical protein